MTPRKVGLAALLAFALSLVSSDVGALPKNLSDNRSLAHTRAPILGTGDTSGDHFKLSISGTSAAVGAAMTKGQQYMVTCTVDTLCEFGASAPTADANSPHLMAAKATRAFVVMDAETTDGDWVACIAQDGASSGTCYFALTY